MNKELKILKSSFKYIIKLKSQEQGTRRTRLTNRKNWEAILCTKDVLKWRLWASWAFQDKRYVSPNLENWTTQIVPRRRDLKFMLFLVINILQIFARGKFQNAPSNVQRIPLMFNMFSLFTTIRSDRKQFTSIQELLLRWKIY